MGAPKQKWTQEEESALKSGVIKHGPGKWRTILKDPEFSGVLYLRSNVDLKVMIPSYRLCQIYNAAVFCLCHYRFFLSDLDWVCLLYLGQDKWRNMSVMANGWGSREKSRLAVKRTLSLPKQEDNSLAITTSLQSDDEMVDVKHYSTTGSSALQVVTTPAPKRPNVRLEISSMSVSFIKDDLLYISGFITCIVGYI